MTVPRIVATPLTEPQEGLPLLVLGASLGTAVEPLWEPAVPLLADHANLLAWDLPGHGRSPAPEEEFTVGELADAVADLVRGQEPRGPVVHAGVSIAGATTLELGVRHAGLFAGLAPICSGPKLGSPEAWTERAATVRDQGTEVMVEGSKGRWFAPGFLERDPETAEALLESLRATDDDGYAACCEALASYDVREALGDVADPLLAINGVEDQVAPPELGAAIASGVRRGRAVALPDVAHLAPAEDPRATVEALASLLVEIGARRG